MAIDFVDPAMVPFISTFLLVFAVVFGLLSYSKTLNFDKRVNALIALAIALFGVFYPPLVQGLYQFMPIVVSILLILFFIAFIRKVLQGKNEEKGTKLSMIATLGFLLLVLGLVGDRLRPYIPGGIDPTTVFWVVGIIIVVGFFWGVYNYKGTGE